MTQSDRKKKTKWLDKQNVTIADIKRALREEGYLLHDDLMPKDGSIPDDIPILVSMASLGYIGHMGMGRSTVSLASILFWLNHDSGAFDPIALGM